MFPPNVNTFMKRLRTMINHITKYKFSAHAYCPGSKQIIHPFTYTDNKIQLKYCPICRDIMGIDKGCPCRIYGPIEAIKRAKKQIAKFFNQ